MTETEENVNLPLEVALHTALKNQNTSVIHYIKYEWKFKNYSKDELHSRETEILKDVLKVFQSFRWYGDEELSMAWLTKLMESILIKNRHFTNTRSWKMKLFKYNNIVDFLAYDTAEKLLKKKDNDTVFQALSYRYPFYCKKDVSTLNSPIVCFKDIMMVKIRYINLYSPSESRYEFLYLWKIAQKKNEPLGLLPLTFIQMVCVYLYRYDALSMDLNTYQHLSIV